MKASEFSFKKGLYQLNPQPNFNFQLNRIIMWDGGSLEEYKAKGLVNLIVNQKMKHGDSTVVWGLKHGMFAYEASSPFEYLQKISDYQLAPAASEIRQDILILGASQDHFVDYRTVDKLIRMLTNVRSLTFRLMTEAMKIKPDFLVMS